jgi:hypothetical protein
MQNLILGKALEGLGTPAQLESVKSFFSGRNTSGINQTLSQQLEHMGNRIAWGQRDTEDVKAWLQRHEYLQEPSSLPII